MNGRIRTDAVVRWMQADGLLEAVVFDDDPARPSWSGIGDTADAAWTHGMQRAWPHFIMGVSRLWIELIRELERDGDWPNAPEARYAAIREALDMQWRDEGGYALLHHLNAVFCHERRDTHFPLQLVHTTLNVLQFMKMKHIEGQIT